MSEKRFTSYYERGNEVVIEDNGKRLSNKKVVVLLNELAEENKQLKKRNKFLEEFDGQAKIVANLKEENEQLRKELDNFKPVMFQDMRKGTVILYSKGDIDE